MPRQTIPNLIQKIHVSVRSFHDFPNSVEESIAGYRECSVESAENTEIDV